MLWLKILVIGVLSPRYLENRDNNNPKLAKQQEFYSAVKLVRIWESHINTGFSEISMAAVRFEPMSL